MKKRYSIFGLIILAWICTGCASVGKIFNPYDDEFACPYSDPGMCTSVTKAYNASLAEHDGEQTEMSSPVNSPAPCEEGKCPEIAPVIVKSGPDSQDVYKQRKYETLAGLIHEETPPVVIPPEVVRVLILSYTGSENEMFGFRYAYFFATDPTWMPSTAIAN